MIGRRVAAARTYAGLSTIEFALRCGMRLDAIEGIEDGVALPTVEVSKILAEELRVPEAWLLWGTEDVPGELNSYVRDHFHRNPKHDDDDFF